MIMTAYRILWNPVLDLNLIQLLADHIMLFDVVKRLRRNLMLHNDSTVYVFFFMMMIFNKINSVVDQVDPFEMIHTGPRGKGPGPPRRRARASCDD